MSGYRNRSSFDPYAYQGQGRPMRPFNWVQWLGVAVSVGGVALYALYFAGRFGWTGRLLDSPTLGFATLLAGVVLINSRREPGVEVGSEQLAKNRKVLLITVVVVAAILGAALVIEFSGV